MNTFTRRSGKSSPTTASRFTARFFFLFLCALAPFFIWSQRALISRWRRIEFFLRTKQIPPILASKPPSTPEAQSRNIFDPSSINTASFGANIPAIFPPDFTVTSFLASKVPAATLSAPKDDAGMPMLSLGHKQSGSAASRLEPRIAPVNILPVEKDKSFMESNPGSPDPTTLQSKKRESLLIWSTSPQCHGAFLAFEQNLVRTKDDGRFARPTLILHDVAVDNRHAFRAVYDAEHVNYTARTPYRRLNAAISSRLDVEPASVSRSKMLRSLNNSDQPSAFLSGPLLKMGWRVEIDHIHWDVGVRTWFVSIMMFGPISLQNEQDFQKHIDKMLQRPKKLSVSVEMRLPVFWGARSHNAGKITHSRLSFSLSCVYGMASTVSGGNQMLRNLMPRIPMPKDCDGAIGSVLVAGSALHGFKRDNELGRREVANFIARAINGPIRFDTVAIPILIDFSVANIESICGGNDKCTQSYHDKNTALLRNISFSVERELSELRVPNSKWNRVAFFPVCTLGNDFDGVERGKSPCISITVANGFAAQVMVQDFSYTLFSPYHKWFAFLDVDEFLVDEKKYLASQKNQSATQFVAPESAFSLFNRRAESSTRVFAKNKYLPNSIMAGWLDFAILDDQRRNITWEHARRGGLDFASTLAYRNSSGRNITAAIREDCSRFYGWYGKHIVSCGSDLVGIRYHSVVRLRPEDFTIRTWRMNAMDPDLRVYHARARPASGPRFGDCLWIPKCSWRR